MLVSIMVAASYFYRLPENSGNRSPLLPGDETIGQLVFVVGLARKVRGEDLAAACYGFTKRVASLTRLQSFGQNIDDLLPGADFNFRIDAAVGEHFDAMLQQRNENKYSSVIAGIVKPVFAKRCEGQGMNSFRDAIL